jgi:hypothetical protein
LISVVHNPNCVFSQFQGQQSEWALLWRHTSEKTFGVQICGNHPDTIARVLEMITNSAPLTL